MTEAGRNVNGVANLVMCAAMVVATVIGVVAIVQQPWFWWQMGLAISSIAFFWGLMLAAVAHAIQ